MMTNELVCIHALKDEYEQLSRKIEDAVGKSIPFDVSQDYAIFTNVERNNHPTIIKVYTAHSSETFCFFFLCAVAFLQSNFFSFWKNLS